jgi:hypothetical protein
MRDLLKRGDFVLEGGASHARGLVLSAGSVTYDVIWLGGSTSRYRQDSDRCVKADPVVEDFTSSEIRQLTNDAADAREERRTGARIKRGQIWPSR